LSEPTKSQILEGALTLLSDDDRHDIRNHAQALMLTIHKRNPYQKIMFGDGMAMELLYEIGRFLNEQDQMPSTQHDI